MLYIHIYKRKRDDEQDDENEKGTINKLKKEIAFSGILLKEFIDGPFKTKISEKKNIYLSLFYTCIKILF